MLPPEYEGSKASSETVAAVLLPPSCRDGVTSPKSCQEKSETAVEAQAGAFSSSGQLTITAGTVLRSAKDLAKKNPPPPRSSIGTPTSDSLLTKPPRGTAAQATPLKNTTAQGGASASLEPALRPLRSAPAKPKCLAPPISTQAQQQQQQQQQLLGRTRRQNSLDNVPLLRDDLKHHRLLLFDECEKTQKRLQKLLVDSKAENLSVQGDEKFEKVVAFNKQLRQFKRIHDRNKVLCQESLQELSSEEDRSAGIGSSSFTPSPAPSLPPPSIPPPLQDVAVVGVGGGHSRQLRQEEKKESSRVTKDGREASRVTEDVREASGPRHLSQPQPKITAGGHEAQNRTISSMMVGAKIETTFPVESDSPVQNMGLPSFTVPRGCSSVNSRRPTASQQAGRQTGDSRRPHSEVCGPVQIIINDTEEPAPRETDFFSPPSSPQPSQQQVPSPVPLRDLFPSLGYKAGRDGKIISAPLEDNPQNDQQQDQHQLDDGARQVPVRTGLQKKENSETSAVKDESVRKYFTLPRAGSQRQETSFLTEEPVRGVYTVPSARNCPHEEKGRNSGESVGSVLKSLQKEHGNSLSKEEPGKWSTNLLREEQTSRSGTRYHKEEPINTHGTSPQKEECIVLGTSFRKKELSGIGESVLKEESTRSRPSIYKEIPFRIGTTVNNEEPTNGGTLVLKEELSSSVRTSLHNKEQTRTGTSLYSRESAKIGTNVLHEEPAVSRTILYKDGTPTKTGTSHFKEPTQIGTSIEESRRSRISIIPKAEPDITGIGINQAKHDRKLESNQNIDYSSRQG